MLLLCVCVCVCAVRLTLTTSTISYTTCIKTTYLMVCSILYLNRLGGIPAITSLKYRDALTMAVGTRTGQVTHLNSLMS